MTYLISSTPLKYETTSFDSSCHHPLINHNVSFGSNIDIDTSHEYLSQSNLVHLPNTSSTDKSDKSDLHVSSNDYITSDESEQFENINELLVKHLKSWHFKNNISHAASSEMLKIWKRFTNFNLPSDSRTLFATPRKMAIKAIDGGHYCHYGLSRAIECIFSALKINVQTVDHINLMINIDGLPLSKSGKSSFWPIMCSDPRLTTEVFLIGVFHGYGKPQCSNEFFEEFLAELIPIIKITVFLFLEEVLLGLICGP